jgi:ABC-type glycerol-3-phosphate transport system permease component
MKFATKQMNTNAMIPGHVETASDQLRLWCLQMMVFLGICIILLPIAWLFLTAFKFPRDVYALETAFYFTPTLENLQTIFEHPWNLGHKILNSFLVAGGTVLLAIPMATMAAYAFSIHTCCRDCSSLFFDVQATQYAGHPYSLGLDQYVNRIALCRLDDEGIH